MVERRDAQRRTTVEEPTTVASGPPITSPGGHCFFLGGEVSNTAEIAAAVQERADRRVDVVKVTVRPVALESLSGEGVPQLRRHLETAA